MSEQHRVEERVPEEQPPSSEFANVFGGTEDHIAESARKMGVTRDELVDMLPKTWDEARMFMDILSKHANEWAGVPVPIDNVRIRVEDRYPYKGIEQLRDKDELEPEEELATVLTEDGEDSGLKVVTKVRNKWYSRTAYKTGGWVYLYQINGSRVRLAFYPNMRGGSVRLTMWMSTAGCMQAWGMRAEIEAQQKLMSLISEHQFEMYFLTGTFIESSKRSGVFYMFRRGRPTVALVPSDRSDPEKHLNVLAALCLHPIAYYEQTWAGAMCPTDDVIAHLLMMRGDEHKFWKHANQHGPDEPESGL